MVSFIFSVDDEPPHSGFSLGHLDIVGRDGAASTRAKVPDQRLMVYLSAAQLLWDAQVVLEGGSGTRTFVGADSSFSLTFTRRQSTLDISHGKDLVDSCSAAEFAAAVLASAKALYQSGSADVSEDRDPLQDLGKAIEEFEVWL